MQDEDHSEPGHHRPRQPNVSIVTSINRGRSRSTYGRISMMEFLCRSRASSGRTRPWPSGRPGRIVLSSGCVAADGGRAVWAGRTSSGIEQVAHHEDLRLRDATQGCTSRTNTMHRSVEHLTTRDWRSETTTCACRLVRLEVLLLLTHFSRCHRAQLIPASSRRNHSLAASHTRRVSISGRSRPRQDRAPVTASGSGAGRSRLPRAGPGRRCGTAIPG